MSILRAIKKEIDFIKSKYPVLAITGPRQSGKTTFLKNKFPEYKYINLENPDNREFAEKDTRAFLKIYDKYTIIDEAQRVPKLFSYIQAKVDEDEDKIMGQYILSGSQNFNLLANITQSLAGRVALFKLFPLDFSEMKSVKLLSEEYQENLVRGFYPAIFDRNIQFKLYSNYIQTYIERDLTEILNVKDLKAFRNFIVLSANRVGQLLNLNSLANECGISQPTAKSWLSVLESSYIIFLLQPYHHNYNKRISKSPKLYFYDTGLLSYLLKIKNSDDIFTNIYKGNLFENYIIAELVKQNARNNLMRDYYFWRDVQNHEVDLLWQENHFVNIVKIKATKTISQDMFKGIVYFNNLAKNSIKSSTLVHTGTFTQKRTLANVLSWNAIQTL